MGTGTLGEEMNNRRKFIAALGASALATPFSAFAQQGKVWRIGFLSSENAVGYRTRVDALRAGLRDFGYEEGKNLVIEFRWAEGKNDRLPALAAELVKLPVDLIVTHAIGAVAAKKVTNTIPIVMATSADPIALGIVTSLARPGGNLTGSTFFPRELEAKRIELLKDAFPRIAHVAVLVQPTSTNNIETMEATARLAKVTLHQFAPREPRDFEGVFAVMVKQRVSAVSVPDNPLYLANAKVIADLAIKHRLPLIGSGEFADAGGMIGFGANLLELYRRAGFFVDKILKGTSPGVIPVEQPARFEFVINMKTAKVLGIKLPELFMQRAERLIE
jgi:putative ABC transport system substrate-binding protein